MLADGVRTYDALDETSFYLRAYILFKIDDIIAIEKVLNMKGHNAFSPCRSCEIKGVRRVTAGIRGTVYYTPLTTPHDVRNQVHNSLDAEDLPLRSHEIIISALQEMDDAPTRRAHDEISRLHGLRCEPTLTRVNSLDYSLCAPWEWMHLFLENIVPTLIKLWTGQFKGIDEGKEQYEIAPHIREQIGAETAASTATLPAAFVRKLPNIADGAGVSNMTAESWGFWIMFIAPAVL